MKNINIEDLEFENMIKIMREEYLRKYEEPKFSKNKDGEKPHNIYRTELSFKDE